MGKHKAGQFAKHSSIYAGGNILRQLVGFIMLPIYTQYLTPSDYGIIGLLTFAISLIDLLFGARLVQAVPKFYHEVDDQKAKYTVISTAMIQTATISAVAVTILILFRSNVSNQILGSPDYQLVFSLFAISTLTLAIENYGLLFIRIQGKPWLFLVLNICKLASQLSLNLYFVVHEEMGVMGVAISTASVSILFAVILATITLRQTGIRYRTDLGRRMIQFCWPLWAAGIAGLYIGSANRYYMKVFSSLDDIGLYELASRFAMILTVLIWRPISLYWQTERFKYYTPGEPAPSIYASVFSYSTTLLIISGLGISLFADPIIQIMAQESYHTASSIVPILTLAAILSALSGYLNFSFLATDNTRYIAKNNYFNTIPATIFYIALIPAYGFNGAAIAYMLTAGFQFLIVYRASKKYYDMKLNIFALCGKLAIAITACLIIETLINQSDILWSVAIRSLIFVIAALLILSILLSNKDYRQEVTNTIKAVLSRKLEDSG